jgi:hypothetical protein
MKNILLISSINQNDGGSIYIKKSLDFFFEDYFIYQIKLAKGVIGVLSRIYFSRFFSIFCRFPAMFYLKLFFANILTSLHVKFLYNKVIIDNETRLMVVTEDIYSYLLAIKIKKKDTTIKIHLSTFDFPWTYKNSKINNKIIKRVFCSNIKWVDSADFVSEAMTDLIVSEGFVGDYCITHAAIDVSALTLNDLEFKTNILESNKNKLVFIGNLRFKKELLYFANSLAGNHIITSKIHCFTPYIVDATGIVMHSYINTNKRLIKELSNYDYGLVPMSFNIVDRELVETSFPSKSYSYLCSGLPLLVFAPKYAAISKVVERYDIGIVCDSLHSENIRKSVELISKKDYSKNIADYLKEEKKNQQILKEMLN